MALILVATPDTQLSETLQAETGGLGHDTVWVADGYEAVATAEQHPVALAFLDLSLPTYNGFEVCQMLRGNPDVPATLALILLGDDTVSTRQVAAVGASGHFPKTHSEADLREVLSRHLEGEVQG